jgi:hypothetical protein
MVAKDAYHSRKAAEVGLSGLRTSFGWRAIQARVEGQPLMNLAGQRQRLLDDHARLQGRHREVIREGAQLHDLREHHEELQEHHSALAAHETSLSDLPPADRIQLSLATTIEAAETMLVETARAVDEARNAWRKATSVYQKVRNMLDREE